jgi:hypothetical protein
MKGCGIKANIIVAQLSKLGICEFDVSNTTALGWEAFVGAGLLYDTNGWHVSIAFYNKGTQHIRDGVNPPRAGFQFLG